MLAYQLTQVACCFNTSVYSILICSFVLVGLDESCPTYIILELHLYFSLNRKEKKKRNSPLNYLCISLSLSMSPRPSVLLSPTPPSHITPLITLRWEANQRLPMCVSVCD